MKKSEKGITLIALVITIIILLILAGVSLNLIAGSEGILKKATDAVDTSNAKSLEEEINLAIVEKMIEFYETRPEGFDTAKEYVKDSLSNDGIKTANGNVTLDEDGKTIIYISASDHTRIEGIYDETTGEVNIESTTPKEEKVEVGTTKKYVTIADKEYTFTCIDTNYQGHHLYLCDEVILYSNCVQPGTADYRNSALSKWLNENAPEDALEITLEDTGTTEKMFILSKEEVEKYKSYIVSTFVGSEEEAKAGFWTRTWARTRKLAVYG